MTVTAIRPTSTSPTCRTIAGWLAAHKVVTAALHEQRWYVTAVNELTRKVTVYGSGRETTVHLRDLDDIRID